MVNNGTCHFTPYIVNSDSGSCNTVVRKQDIRGVRFSNVFCVIMNQTDSSFSLKFCSSFNHALDYKENDYTFSSDIVYKML